MSDGTQPVIELGPITGSSNIAAAGYHAESKSLDLKFMSGATYRHADVPQEVYDGLQAAQSKGKFYAAAIRGKFETVRLDKPAEEASTVNPQAAWPFPTQSR